MRSRSAGEAGQQREQPERGSATAEFAMVLPAIVLVLACCLSALQLAGRQLRLQDAAAAAARSAARGDGVEVASRLVSGAAASRWQDGELECVRLTTTAPLLGALLPVELVAASCAPGGGR